MRNKGFTLIEIVAYLAVLVIIASIAIPSYRIISNARFNKNVRNVISDIRYIKDMTYLYSKEYKIEFRQNGYNVVDEKGNVVKNYIFDKGTYFEDYELNRGPKKVNYMSYALSGNARASGTLIISNFKKSKQRKISIVPVTGRVLLIED